MVPAGRRVIEEGEDTLTALRRELWEEIGLDVEGRVAQYLGRFSAPAANERDHMVPAAAYHIRVNRVPEIKSQIEEAIWVDASQAEVMALARDHILPVAGTL